MRALSLTLMRMWGFPTIKRRALGRVMATLNRLGLARKPSALCKSSLCTDSLERTYIIREGIERINYGKVMTDVCDPQTLSP